MQKLTRRILSKRAHGTIIASVHVHKAKAIQYCSLNSNYVWSPNKMPMSGDGKRDLCLMSTEVLCMRVDCCSVVPLIGLNAILFHVCQHLPHFHHLFALTPGSDQGCVGSQDGQQPCSFCIFNQGFNTLHHSTLQLCTLQLCSQNPLALTTSARMMQHPILLEFAAMTCEPLV